MARDAAAHATREYVVVGFKSELTEPTSVSPTPEPFGAANMPEALGRSKEEEENAGAGARMEPVAESAASRVQAAAAAMSRRPVKGASLMLVSLVGDGTHLPCLLLAREKGARWLCGKGKSVYTDFGGAASTDGERNCPEAIAAREFVEETLGAVRYFGDAAKDDVRVLRREVQRSLENGEYLAKVETPLHDGSKYVSFVKQVPWQEGVSRLFQNTRALLLRAREGYADMSAAQQRFVDAHPAVLRPLSPEAGVPGPLNSEADVFRSCTYEAAVHDPLSAKADAPGPVAAMLHPVATGLSLASSPAVDTDGIALDGAYFEKANVEYFSLSSVAYYVETGTWHAASSFGCRSYFRARLRTVVRAIKAALKEAAAPAAHARAVSTFDPGWGTASLRGAAPARATTGCPSVVCTVLGHGDDTVTLRNDDNAINNINGSNGSDGDCDAAENAEGMGGSAIVRARCGPYSSGYSSGDPSADSSGDSDVVANSYGDGIAAGGGGADDDVATSAFHDIGDAVVTGIEAGVETVIEASAATAASGVMAVYLDETRRRALLAGATQSQCAATETRCRARAQGRAGVSPRQFAREPAGEPVGPPAARTCCSRSGRSLGDAFAAHCACHDLQVSPIQLWSPGDYVAAFVAPHRRIASNSGSGEDRFRHGPLSNAVDRVLVDNKQRWRAGEDELRTRRCASHNSTIWAARHTAAETSTGVAVAATAVGARGELGGAHYMQLRRFRGDFFNRGGQSADQQWRSHTQ